MQPGKIIPLLILLAFAACKSQPRFTDEVKGIFISADDLESTGLKIHPSIRKTWSYWEAQRDLHFEMGGEQALISPEGGTGTLTSVVGWMNDEKDNPSVALDWMETFFTASFAQKGITPKPNPMELKWGDEIRFQDLYRGETPSGHLFMARSGRKLFLFLALEVSIREADWNPLMQGKLNKLDAWQN
ncbi:MAG: hypothetical protein H6581_18465 [Bacteroidia bacterium]|nr:hypothetical protein [Bacteroidia bacterium]